MRIDTHIAFGLFFGMFFYYFLGFDFGFVLLTGFAAFIPDIDWAMQFRWHMGKVHRKFGHNIWFMLVVSFIGYFMLNSILLLLGIIVGFLSHLIADSFTVTGIYWLYPYGRNEEKFHLKWQLNMSEEKEKKIERMIRTILLIFAGFLFIVKGVSINLLSIEGIITFVVLVYVGYLLMNKFDTFVVKLIRSWKI